MRPDLVVAFSDLQAQITHDLVQAGFTVFTMNQRSVRGILEAILMLGSLVGATDAARQLIDTMQRDMESIQQRGTRLPRHPQVYFEEWYDPLISGIGWVGELIEIAGGDDIFPDVMGNNAKERIISADEVVRRNPDLIIASWCGKKVDMQNIFNRPNWDKVKAIKNQRVYEIKSAHILQPGPAILEGLRQIHRIIQQGFA